MKKGSHCIKRADFYAEKEGFYAEKEGGGGRGGGGWGASKTRPGPDASRAGKTLPSISWHAKGRPSRGACPQGVFWASPDEALGEGSPCAEKARATGLKTRGERTKKLLILY